METRIAGVTGSQDQPFYELLHPGGTSNPSSESNGPAKTMDNLDIAEDLLLPSYSKPQAIQDNTIFGSSTGSNSASGLTSDDKSAPVPAPPPPPRRPLYSSTMHSSNEYFEPAKGRKELDRDGFEAAMMASVESTMKKYADNLLCSLEAISGKLSQLEYTTQHLESSMEELKLAVGNSHGETDGRMRLLENILREVQTGVQLLRDKQEISEARSQLKSQFLKNDYSGSTSLQASSESKPIDTQQQIGYGAQQQPVAAFSLPSAPQPSHSAMTSSPSLPPPSHQPGSPPIHAFPVAAPQQVVSLQGQSSSILGRQQMLPPTTVVPSESSYQSSPQQSSSLLPPLPPPLQYQVSSHMQQVSPNAIQMSPYCQQQQQQPSSQAFSPLPVQSELPTQNLVHPVPHPQMQVPTPSPPSQYGSEPPYMPTSYGGPNSQQQPRSISPTQIPLSSPQGFTGGQPVYESSFGRTGSGPLPLAPAYGRGPSGPMYGDSQSYGSPPFRVPQVVPSAPSGVIGHPRLPSAKPVQHSLPVAASINSSPSGSSAPSNRVPVDDVVDKVTAMGFSREQVRAVVRRLTENGQSVDLNVVLDKLMNGGEIQPQKAWFGR